MLELELKEMIPTERDEWITQKVMYGYYGLIRLGSLFVVMDEDSEPIYGYEVDGQVYELPDTEYCETWDDAESIFLEVMFDHFSDQASYYSELKRMCNELIKEHMYFEIVKQRDY